MMVELSNYCCWITDKDWQNFKGGQYPGKQLPDVVLFPTKYLTTDCCKIDNNPHDSWLYVNAVQEVEDPNFIYLNTSYRGNLWKDEDLERPGPLTPNALAKHRGNANSISYLKDALPKSPLDLPRRGVLNGCLFKTILTQEDRMGPTVAKLLPNTTQTSKPLNRLHTWTITSCAADQGKIYPLLESVYGDRAVRNLHGNEPLTTLKQKLDWVCGDTLCKDPRMAYHERARRRFSSPTSHLVAQSRRYYNKMF